MKLPWNSNKPFANWIKNLVTDLYFIFSTNQKKGGLESFPDANLSLITDNRQQVKCGADLLADPGARDAPPFRPVFGENFAK